jgi:hypothetical protein
MIEARAMHQACQAWRVVDPDDPPRWWTVAEANGSLERVRELTERARRAMSATQGNGHGAAARSELAATVAELEADGIVLRDIERGLVDFPARAPSGRSYWLCWLVDDEDSVEWWHWPEAGFAGRTPLTEPPQ